MALLLLGGVTSCGTGSVSGSTVSSSVAPPASNAAPRQVDSPSAHPPYIEKVVWVTLPSGRSLQVYPTADGRIADATAAESEAWHEVLRKAPDAGTPGMRAQFDCHWQFARLAAPNKPSWNLEPWRPVVSGEQMYDARCNPGGPEV